MFKVISNSPWENFTSWEFNTQAQAQAAIEKYYHDGGAMTTRMPA
jgi:hypothetical protein